MQKSDGDKVENLIEPKLPLWWIIASSVAIVFSMGGVIVKLDELGTSVQKIEAKIDAQEARLIIMDRSIYESKAENRIQQTQLDRIDSVMSSHIQRTTQ